MTSPVLFLFTDGRIRQADPASPHLLVTDWGASRGDGVFESVSVIEGRMPPLDDRLDRLVASAAALDLPLPDRALWAEAIARAIEAHDHVPRLAITLALTRGVEGHGEAPSAWLLAKPARDFATIRRSGISVVTLDRGYRSDAAEAAPWLLLGAKHLSYATNAAALREAARRGADDVIFTSTDGVALEGPTSSLIVRRGSRIVSPSLDSGILAGTTQAAVFAFFEANGFDTASVSVAAESLASADGLWLVSSVRQAVAVHTLDGIPVPTDRDLTERLNDWLAEQK
ncbi:aminotransferase class IV [Agreia sp. COWG]|uniref:aminotransferase class IV n=1 Tax=Agreia sp. COWG TaxID=2773266 RepID=UPI001925F9D7|nr:aminotransferase class IV [Agreia sp. COWG]